MMASKHTIFGPLYRFCRWYWRVTHRRHPIYGMEHIAEQPAVFVGRHQNMYGPVEMMAWIPMEFRVWTLSTLMDAKECYHHFSTYTFPSRYRMPGPIAKLCAGIVAPLTQAFFRSMRSIAVYRGRKEILTTFRESLKALREGHNLLIMPERDYTDQSGDAGEMYNGFLHLAQMYWRAEGKALHFYPIYPSKQDSAIYIGRPVVFDATIPFQAERERLIAALQAELSRHSIERDFRALREAEETSEAKPT